MAPGDPLAPEMVIYRGLSNKYLNDSGEQPNDIAFLLKPAHGEWPAETYLSFGTSPDGARKGLTRIKKICEITVADVLALGLTVTQDDDPDKVQVSGMPLPTQNDADALYIAKQLREKSRICK